MAALKQGKQVLTYLLGQCMPTAKENAVKIRIKRIGLDKNLLMYFNEYEFVYAHDPLKQCKTGDTVLIQNLPEKMTRLITHRVVEVIYPLGDITDPLTGKKIVVSNFRDDVKKANAIYGESENAFDYDKQPPRGSQEGKRDYSHRPGLKKWYDDPNDPQPHAV